MVFAWWTPTIPKTSNPNFGYDGKPAEPSPTVFAFDTRRGFWQTLPSLLQPSMDHRGMAVVGDLGWLVGGMATGQRVSADAVAVPLRNCGP
ncbi:MAG: hypothetical protein U5K74_11910 [Gemmatimonadaceae bacterium]|nr:hypothetical protein [Gemmatimonadaceae bacterium]